ncbi:Omp28-related outer membrane protein [Aequorivita xiaoshiensis]|uniref:Omp28-related outer membrane protein n=1 Tax=Aequorivita xiaoshiensis TaxID=2874476 RepID=A0A9X1U5U6_9FLAO|nr:Omp28-related outer membrane protein [Aequorivita xiaoshiensis]
MPVHVNVCVSPLIVYVIGSEVIGSAPPGHPYEGLGNPIEDYVHNDALRNSLSDLFGDAIPSTPAFQEFKKNYTFTVPSNYVGENLSFVVMVVDQDNNAKNSQFASINEIKNFE